MLQAMSIFHSCALCVSIATLTSPFSSIVALLIATQQRTSCPGTLHDRLTSNTTINTAKPTEMCIKYICRACQTTNVIYCDTADWDQVDPDCQRPLSITDRHLRRRKCHTCVDVEGAITVLRHMVFQNPWLETHGLSGAENRNQWEIQNNLRTDHDMWSRDYKEEDHELMTRLKEMKLDQLDGRDELNDGHGIDEAVNNEFAIDTMGQGESTISERQGPSWSSDEGTLTLEGSHEAAEKHEKQDDQEKR